MQQMKDIETLSSILISLKTLLPNCSEEIKKLSPEINQALDCLYTNCTLESWVEHSWIFTQAISVRSDTPEDTQFCDLIGNFRKYCIKPDSQELFNMLEKFSEWNKSH